MERVLPSLTLVLLSLLPLSVSLSFHDDVYIFIWTRRIFVCLFCETKRRGGCVVNVREAKRDRHRESKIDSIVKSKLQGNEQLAAGSRD